jgi:hypothetical protein
VQEASEVIEEESSKCRETAMTAGAGARPRFMHDRQLGRASDHVEAGATHRGLAPVLTTGRAERMLFFTSPSGPGGGVSHLPIHFPALLDVRGDIICSSDHTVLPENAL